MNKLDKAIAEQKNYYHGRAYLDNSKQIVFKTDKEQINIKKCKSIINNLENQINGKVIKINITMNLYDFKGVHFMKSMIGHGTAYIFRNMHKDSLAYFKDDDNVYVAKDLEDAIEHSLGLTGDNATVLVINGPHDVLWATPVINGVL